MRQFLALLCALWLLGCTATLPTHTEIPATEIPPTAMATPTEIPTATPTKEPTPTPKPELPSVITPEMVDQYFVGISAEEAQRLFAETGQFVLPFDPTKIEGEFSILEESGNWQGEDFVNLVFKVPVGTEFMAPFTGKANFYSVVQTPDGTFIKGAAVSQFGIENEGFKINFDFVDGEIYFPDGERDVEVSTPLFRVSSTESPDKYVGLVKGNVVVYWETLDFSLENLLVDEEGRYAFISS